MARKAEKEGGHDIPESSSTTWAKLSKPTWVFSLRAGVSMTMPALFTSGSCPSLDVTVAAILLTSSRYFDGSSSALAWP